MELTPGEECEPIITHDACYHWNFVEITSGIAQVRMFSLEGLNFVFRLNYWTPRRICSEAPVLKRGNIFDETVKGPRLIQPNSYMCLQFCIERCCRRC